ncbi:unnamed protein product [Hydatigera taeniaeformis]|uniref:26S proteasome non-ATPase regulatory subunit 5 n=1 Tax=Hydatigena taeniaeformis TaxID=6205 RepID=A0A0R3X6N0_HYDTA|nr:unnamed protein product [Hydatigera taeniaeformis]
MTKVYETIDRLSRLSSTLQEYEDLYIMLRNLSRGELEEAVSRHNLLDIFGHIDLSVSHPEGVKMLLKDASLMNHFNSLTGDEEIIRLSEIFAYIASQRKESFKEMINCPIFDRLISVLSKSDPLLQLNTLAVLKLLLVFPDGRTFLQTSGAVAHLFTDLQTLKENPLHDILLPGYLSFFATLAEEEPTDFLANPIYRQPLIHCLAGYLTTSDPIITVAAIETIAQICRTMDGKGALAVYLGKNPESLLIKPKPGACLAPLFSKAASIMLNASAGTLPRILLAMADVLSLPDADDISAQLPMSELTHEWFNFTSAPSPPTRLLGRIWELARQPFKEVRSAALNLLRALATEPWGLTLFVQMPGFLEYLLNPTTEVGTAVDGSSLQPEKFGIVYQCDLTQEHWKGHTTRWSLLDDETAARLKRRIKDGVWGQTRAQAAVAMENE